MKHSEVLKQLRAISRKTDRHAIAGAFLASLGTPPGLWRAPIAALAAAERVPTHRYRAFSASSTACHECGLEPTVPLDPEDIPPHGDILPGDLEAALLVLSTVRDEEPPAPTAADVKRFVEILSLIGKLPATARIGQLVDALRKAKLVRGDKYVVRSVVETLGACGILETPEHPGFTSSWTSFAARQDRPSTRVEVDPPLAFWTASHGVNGANVAHWFGAFGVVVPKVPKVPKSSSSAKKRAARAPRRADLPLDA